MKKRKSSRSWEAISATCAVAGLVSTWDTPAQAQNSFSFSGAITPTHDLTSVYFLFAAGICSPGGGVFAKEIAAFLPANVTTTFNITLSSVPGEFLNEGPSPSYSYTIAGLYDTSGDVTVAYDPSQAANVLAVDPAPQWTDNLLPAWGGGLGVWYRPQPGTEADTAAALQSGSFNGISMNDALVNGPLAASGSPFPYEVYNGSTSDFTLVDFSGAALGGSGYITQVPEPTTTALFAAGAGFLSSRLLRRRGKS